MVGGFVASSELVCFSSHFGFIDINHLISIFTQAAESV